jgi:hypothetical protein
MFIIIHLLLFSCREDGRIDHIDGNAPAPAQVSDVTVRGTPGGAVLKYKLPKDENLLYVQAIYETQPGVQRKAKSSCDSLVLEGYGDTQEYDIMLYSVGRNEKMSEPLTVPIKPTTPLVRLTTKSMREILSEKMGSTCL